MTLPCKECISFAICNVRYQEYCTTYERAFYLYINCSILAHYIDMNFSFNRHSIEGAKHINIYDNGTCYISFKPIINFFWPHDLRSKLEGRVVYESL